MFNTLNFMAINRCCILGSPYNPTLPYTNCDGGHEIGELLMTERMNTAAIWWPLVELVMGRQLGYFCYIYCHPIKHVHE